jgi:hypothetical protein
MIIALCIAVALLAVIVFFLLCNVAWVDEVEKDLESTAETIEENRAKSDQRADRTDAAVRQLSRDTTLAHGEHVIRTHATFAAILDHLGLDAHEAHPAPMERVGEITVKPRVYAISQSPASKGIGLTAVTTTTGNGVRVSNNVMTGTKSAAKAGTKKPPAKKPASKRPPKGGKSTGGRA